MLRRLSNLTLFLLLVVGSVCAQNPNTAVYPAGAATDTDLLIASNRAITTLTSPLTNNGTTINISNTSLFTVPTVVTIDSEIIEVCAKTSTTFTVCSGGRGFNNTSAASHSSAANVLQNATSYFHNQLAVEIIALENYAVNTSSTYSNPAWITALAGTKITGSVPTADALTSTPSGCAAGKFAISIDVAGNLTCDTPASAATLLFSGITSATNTTAAMVVGSGASLSVSGSGTIHATTADALASNPADCSTHQFATSIGANGDLGCAALTDADVPDTITASNYLPLTGGTLSGQLVTSNLGVEFTESDTNPTCSAGNYNIFADLSETKLKKCTNGSVTDLDTSGSGSSPGGSVLSIQYQQDASTFAGITLNVTTTRKFVMQSGDGSTANAPSIVALVSGDIPNNAANTSGNATTASALAADPSDCSTNQFATNIAANGNLTCAQPTEANLSTSDITTNNVTSTKHGLAPKSPGDATKFLNGAATNAYAQVKDSDLALTDITTNNASTSNHGFLRKLDNIPTHYMDGTGAFTTPTGTGATTNQTYRTIGAYFDGGGSAITNSSVSYVTVPYACTIGAWTILVDTGTISFDVWKIGTGSAIPTVSNTIMTGGYLSISSGTAVLSTTLTAFTTTTVTADDIFAVQVHAISSATKASLMMRCAAN